MTLRQRAKQKFLQLRAEGTNVTARKMAERSVEWFGEPITLYTIQDWMVKDQWRKSIIELIKSEQILRYMQLLEESIDRADESTKPLDLAHSARALVTLMTTVPRELNMEYQDRINNICDMIHRTIYGGALGTVTPSTFSSLVKTYSVMVNIVASDAIVETDGHDADAILMGLADAAEADGHGDS